MGFVAGPYTATYDTTAIGTVEDGFELEHTIFQDEVLGDNLGRTPQDTVSRGGVCYLSFTLQEYNPTLLAKLLVPFSLTNGQFSVAGLLGSNAAKALVLTAVSGTPAATTGPATLTASKAILAPNFPLRYFLNSRLRVIPVRLLLLPYTSGANTVHFTTT